MCEDSELAILREMANVAREYFDERNRPAVSWDGMPSVQDQKRRRERIVELLEAVHVPSVISSASPLSEDTKRLDFLQAWCNDMFWASERNPVGEPRLTLSWFIGHGRSPAFDTTGDDWRDAIDQARVKMGDIDRLSASAPSPEDKRQAPGFLTDADIASLPEWK